MAVNMKLGVDLGSFNTGINQAKAQIKTFDAALKQAESQFKATGDAESAMTTKISALSSKLSTQKKIVDDYRRALETMTKNNVDPLSTAFQKMQKEMLLAESAMYDTQTALNELSSSEQKAAQGADALTNSVNSIGKKMSLDQVLNGVNRITEGLENAGKKALQLGEQIFSAVMDKARWADDSATMAMMYGIPLERFLQMQKLVQNGMDTSVDAILGAQSKLAKGIGGESTAAMQALKDLGVSLKTLEDTGDGILEFVDKDPEETFFEIGRALMAMEKAYDKEAAAQTLFGKSWKELVPLFKEYKTLEEYNDALENTKTASEEDVNALAELNDKISTLKGNLDTLSTDILATLAPALSEGADALNGVLSTILEYLRTDKGKEQLQKLGDAIAGLFGDLSKIDPEQVVKGFVEVFTKVTDGVKWLVDNEGTAKGILAAILGVWATAEIGGAVLTVVKLIEGIQGLSGAGAASAGAAAGSGWGAAFAAAVLKAAPWLAGAYALLNPAEGGNDSPFDNKTGMLTNEGWQWFEDYASGKVKDEAWDEIINLVGNRYGGLSDILGNPAAINAMARALYGDHNFVGIDPKAQPDAYRTRINNELFDTLEGMGYEPKIEIEPSEEVKGILERGTLELTMGDPNGKIRTPNGWKEPEVKVDTVPDEKAAENISKEVGTVSIPAKLQLLGFGGPATVGAGGVVGDLEKAWRQSLYDSMRNGYANGIPYVPNTMLAWLHKGETVTPAREVTSRNYSSNLYVERMIMNNGTDANGLADAMAAAQRRQNSGYGS